MTRNKWEVIESDGHVRERDTDLVEFLEEPYRSGDIILNFPFFPTLDGFHRGARRARMGHSERRVDQQSWLDFLDEAGIESAVLYPTSGLACGMIQDPEWAVALCRAYNNWFHERYYRTSSRLRGVALIPLQDVQESVNELRRAATELGAVGAMLPAHSADMGVRKPLGDPSFWPVYAEAQRLNFPIAVHSAPSLGLGFDSMTEDPNLLEHPLAQMIQMTSMLLSGMFDEFPDLKVAYLEADAGWVPYMMDRLTGKGKPGRTDPAEIIRSGRIFFGAEGSGELGLPYAIERLGDDVILYASDYPHLPKDGILRELDELIARPDICEISKQKILKENALRFYPALSGG